MGIGFSARQALVNCSQLERLINRPSAGVADFARLIGWNGLLGHLPNLTVGGAISLLIVSMGAHHGVEPASMVKWTPGLRTETLFILARDLGNWSFEGSTERNMAFNSTLYGSEDEARRNIASMLHINQTDAVALLRFHTPSDVECLSKSQLEFGHSGRPARFSIYATTLAERIKAVCPGTLFFSDVKADTWT